MLIRSENRLLRFARIHLDVNPNGKGKIIIHDKTKTELISISHNNLSMLQHITRLMIVDIFTLSVNKNMERHPLTSEFIHDITKYTSDIVRNGGEVRYISEGYTPKEVLFGSGNSESPKRLGRVRDTGGVFMPTSDGLVRLNKRELVYTMPNYNYTSREKAEDGVYRGHAYFKLPYTKERYLVTCMAEKPFTPKEMESVLYLINNDTKRREIVLFNSTEFQIKIRDVIGIVFNVIALPEKSKWEIDHINHVPFIKTTNSTKVGI